MQRPTSLTIIGWLLIVFAIFGVYSTLSMHDNPVAVQMMERSPLPMAVHQAIGVIGVLVSAASGYGILKGLNWSRYLYLGWGAIAVLISVVTTPFTSIVLLSLVVLAIFAFFLFRPAANAWFTRDSRPAEG